MFLPVAADDALMILKSVEHDIKIIGPHNSYNMSAKDAGYSRDEGSKR